MGRASVAALMAVCVGCDDVGSVDHDSTEPWAAEARTLEDRREAAVEEAASSLSGTTYADLGEPYGCTEDCSGHEAGVAWANENGITDPGDCGGRSQSFIEGCEAFAEQVQADADDLL